MAHCFPSNCIVHVIMIFLTVIGGRVKVDAGGGGGGGNPCNCDFQDDLCCWEVLPLSSRAMWERPSGTVGHQGDMTGHILYDHTYQNDTKYYVQVSAQNEIAILQSSAFNSSVTYCLHFWFYMEVGPGKGNLHVILVNYTTGDLKGAEAQAVWTAPSRTSSNTNWTSAQVDIYYRDKFRIFFLVSHTDYAAIDDVTLVDTPCGGRPTEKPSSTARIASVSESSTTHREPSFSTEKSGSTQRIGSTDFLAVRPTNKPRSTTRTTFAAESSTAHGEPFVSTQKSRSTQRNGSTDFLAVRPTVEPSTTARTTSVAESNTTDGKPHVSTQKSGYSWNTGSTDFLAVRPTVEPSTTARTTSVAESNTTDGKPHVSTQKSGYSWNTGSTDFLAVRLTEEPSTTARTTSMTESNSTDGELYVSTRKTGSSQKTANTDFLPEIAYICIGVGSFLLLASFMGIFLFRKHRNKSPNGNDINVNNPKTVSSFLPSSQATMLNRQNRDRKHGFNTDLYTKGKETVGSHVTGDGVQILSERGKEMYQDSASQGMIGDAKLKIGEVKMGNESIFPKFKQSCNSSLGHDSKVQVQIQVHENELEPNTGQAVLTASSKDQNQTQSNSLTGCSFQRIELTTSNTRDEVSDTWTGRNDHENLAETLYNRPLKPPPKKSSGNDVIYDTRSSLGIQQRRTLGQVFDPMVVSPDKVYHTSDSAKKIRVDRIF